MSENNAYSNASAWMETLKGYVLAMDQETWDRVEELEDTESLSADEALELVDLKEILGEHEDAESAMDNARDSALDVMVRASWHALGDTPSAEEFMILFSTGGPALRMRGELSRYMEPCRAWLEYQDWGTPWTEYHGANSDESALLAYASLFCFDC